MQRRRLLLHRAFDVKSSPSTALWEEGYYLLLEHDKADLVNMRSGKQRHVWKVCTATMVSDVAGGEGSVVDVVLSGFIVLCICG